MSRTRLSVLANALNGSFPGSHTVWQAITASRRVFPRPGSGRFLSSQASHAADEVEECRALAEVSVTGVDVSYPTYMVWGSNTGVGKTLISAGASAYKIHSVLLLNWILVFASPLRDSVANFFTNSTPLMFDAVGWFYVRLMLRIARL